MKQNELYKVSTPIFYGRREKKQREGEREKGKGMNCDSSAALGSAGDNEDMGEKKESKKNQSDNVPGGSSSGGRRYSGNTDGAVYCQYLGEVDGARRGPRTAHCVYAFALGERKVACQRKQREDEGQCETALNGGGVDSIIHPGIT